MGDAGKQQSAQEAAWNGPAGRTWTAGQALLDEAFAGFVPLLAEAVDPGAAVLDVGCGTGATTLALAERAGATGRAVGIDVSAPMLERARERATAAGSSASFVRADAEAEPFAAASFDRIASRFGVMFFADPTAAFANLRRATRPGGRLRWVVWRDRGDNPFMTLAERVAAPWIGPPAPVDPTAPGQFGLADPVRMHALLEAAGWSDVAIAPVDVPCGFPADGLPFYSSRIGGVARQIADRDDVDRDAVHAALLRAYADEYGDGDRVRFTAACWLVQATAPS